MAVKDGDTFIKEVKVNHKFITSGDGYWGMPKDVDGVYDKLVLRVSYYESCGNRWVAELMAHHNLHSNDVNDHKFWSNPIFDSGIPYTDKASEAAASDAAREVPEFLALKIDKIGGSEQGMQGEDYLSCDCNVTVESLEQLYDLGFSWVER